LAVVKKTGRQVVNVFRMSVPTNGMPKGLTVDVKWVSHNLPSHPRRARQINTHCQTRLLFKISPAQVTCAQTDWGDQDPCHLSIWIVIPP